MLRLYEAKIANARNNNGSHLRSISGLRSIAHLLQTAGSDGAVCRQIISLGVFPQEPPDYWGNSCYERIKHDILCEKVPCSLNSKATIPVFSFKSINRLVSKRIMLVSRHFRVKSGFFILGVFEGHFFLGLDLW